MVHSVGAIEYLQGGTDADKISFLQSRIAEDYLKALRFPIPSNVASNGVSADHSLNVIGWDDYCLLSDTGRLMALFEPILASLEAPREPLFVVTPIVDGKVRIDGTSRIITGTGEPPSVRIELQPHFLDKYCHGGHFQFSQLINDDHFEAIKRLLNQGFYVAAIKLLLAAIDTFGYLAYGKGGDSFKRYVDAYFDLSVLDVTTDELWELRNSLLHMTTYDSYKVADGKVRRLIIVIGPFPSGAPQETPDGRNLDIYELFFEAAKSTQRWGAAIFNDQQELDGFLSRYETVISENRMTKFYFK